MNIFDFAMKMELDGKRFYEEQADNTNNAGLKRILLELAADETRHFNIFKALRDGLPAKYDEAAKTSILASTKNVFEQMKADSAKLDISEENKSVWQKAQDVEKKAEEFFREKASELSDENQKQILHRIADEEHKHWITLENVIQFLDQPSQWLEDAEWGSLEE